MLLETTFAALVRYMRQAHKTMLSDCNPRNLAAAMQAEKDVDAALERLNDARPGIHIGCWYGPDGSQAAQPAAYLGLPPDPDGKALEPVLEVHPDCLDAIAPGDEVLHEFILKWERYALENYLAFDVSEDFEVAENRWQVCASA